MKCVYKISCLNNEVKEFYIGSTKDLKDRISKHNNFYKNNYNWKVYKFIRENGGINNWEIIPIEIYECEMTKLELKQEEQFYLDEYKPQLNSQRALGRDIERKYKTKKEWIKNNRNKYLKNRKEYYEKNRDKLNAKQNEKGNCPYCSKEMIKNNIKRHIKTQHTTSS